jgi:hypothetical protein
MLLSSLCGFLIELILTLLIVIRLISEEKCLTGNCPVTLIIKRNLKTDLFRLFGNFDYWSPNLIHKLTIFVVDFLAVYWPLVSC